jgi:hypothetical protein
LTDDPVRRGLSVLSLPSLEYWITRSSRAMTRENVARIISAVIASEAKQSMQRQERKNGLLRRKGSSQ